MMKNLTTSVLALALLVSCTTGSTPMDHAEFTPVTFASTKATAAEKEACEKAGGEIKQVGRLRAEHCIQPYPDAGKLCTDKTECLGWCIFEVGDSEPTPGTPADGICQLTTDSFGCTTLVNDGKIEGTICVD